MPTASRAIPSKPNDPNLLTNLYVIHDHVTDRIFAPYLKCCRLYANP